MKKSVLIATAIAVVAIAMPATARILITGRQVKNNRGALRSARAGDLDGEAQQPGGPDRGAGGQAEGTPLTAFQTLYRSVGAALRRSARRRR
jgi:hypothetical protein